MKKTKFIFVLFFFHSVSWFTYSQNVILSADYLDGDDFSYAKVIGQDTEGIFVLQSNLSLDLEKDRAGFKNRKLKVTYYSRELKPQWYRQLEPFSDAASLEAVSFSNGKVMAIHFVERKNENKTDVYGQWLNNKGMFEGSAKKISEIVYQRNGELKKIKVIVSGNQQTLAIIIPESTAEGFERIHFAAFDTSFNIMAKHDLQVMLNRRDFDVTTHLLSNAGDLVIAGLFYLKEKDVNKNHLYEYHLLTALKSENKFTDIKASIPDKRMTEAGVAIDNLNNAVIVTGFYFDQGTYTGTGLFYAKLNLTENASIELKTGAFTGDTEKALRGQRNTSTTGVLNYPIQKIILRNDGGAVIIAESMFTVEDSYYDYFSQTFIRRTEYHYEDVVVVSVNADGSIDWSNMIKKSQVSVDDGGFLSSFCSLINPDEMILVYNNDIGRHNNITANSISNKGEQHAVNIVRSSEHILLVPDWGKQTAANEVVLPAYQKSKLFLVKITF